MVTCVHVLVWAHGQDAQPANEAWVLEHLHVRLNVLAGVSMADVSALISLQSVKMSRHQA